MHSTVQVKKKSSTLAVAYCIVSLRLHDWCAICNNHCVINGRELWLVYCVSTRCGE